MKLAYLLDVFRRLKRANKWETLTKTRYEVISKLGVDALEDILIRYKEKKGWYDPTKLSTYGYWEAVRDYTIDFLKNQTNGSDLNFEDKELASYLRTLKKL